MVIGYPTWKQFDVNNAQDYDAFETLCRLLFKKRFGITESLPYAFNNAGNETKPIHVGDKMIGFQAKYFDGNTIDESQARNIIHSIETAHANYPEQTKQIIYTNLPFGNPPAGKEKTKNEEDINAAAVANNLELEWIVGNDILDKVIENELLYDIFFNPDVQLKELHKHVTSANATYENSISDSIRTSQWNIAIPRQEAFHKIEELLAQGKDVAIEGESGSGKSAIVKNYCQQHADDVFIWLNASQFETDDVNTLFQFSQSYTIDNVCSFYRNNDKKIIIIDSAEKLLGLKNPRPLALLLNKMHDEQWQFVFTIRRSATKRVEQELNKLGIQPETVNVPVLSDAELDGILEQNEFLKPTDARLYGRIHNLFYLARYCDVAHGNPNTLKEFREQVWDEKIKGIDSALRETREQCVLALAEQIEASGRYIIPKGKLSSPALDSLLRDEIIYDNRIGYSFAHDIYLEWAMLMRMDIRWESVMDVPSFLNEIEDNVIVYNNFRRWFGGKISDHDECVTKFTDSIFTEDMPESWRKAIVVMILRSTDYAPDFFSRYDGKLKEDNYRWGKVALSELPVNCQQVINHIPGYNAGSKDLQPMGSGWRSAIRFIYAHYDELWPKNEKLITSILSCYAKTENESYEDLRKAGLMALKPHQRVAEARKREEDDWLDNEEAACRLVAFYFACILEEIETILDEVLANKWVNHGEPYEELTQFIVKAKNADLIVLYKFIPEQILALMDLYWSASDETDEEEPRLIISSYRVFEPEEAWGLSHERLMMQYFPVSGLQTCIPYMLRLHTDLTVEFIIRFMDKCVRHYAEFMTDDDPVSEVEIRLWDGSTRKKYGNHTIWNLYRGTTGIAAPYVLLSMHMALENYLLQLAKDEKNIVLAKKIMDMILDKAKSLSLVAVVASVVTSDIDKFEEEAIAITSNLQMMRLDFDRCTREDTAGFMVVGNPTRHPAHLGDRRTSNELPHRKKQLEDVLFHIQVENELKRKEGKRELLQKAYQNVDALKEQLKRIPKDEQLPYKYVISRTDVRMMTKKPVSVNGEYAIYFDPYLDDEQLKSTAKMVQDEREMLIGPNLRMWATCRMKGKWDYIANLEYEKDPQKALADSKKIVAQLAIKEGGLTLMPEDEYVPPMVWATLLKDFGDKLSKADIEYCEKNLIDALSDAEFMLESSMSGLKECLDAVDAILSRSHQYDDECSKILRTYATKERDVDGERSCYIVAEMIEQHEMWTHHEAFMRNTAEAMISEQGEEPDVDDAEWLLCLFPTYPDADDFRRVVKRNLETLSHAWDEESEYAKMYVHRQLCSARTVARMLISAPDTEISELVAYYSRYTKSCDHDSLLISLMYRTALNNAYERFWVIWNGMYDAIVKERTYSTHDTVLNVYMLNPDMPANWGQDWFHVKESDVAFFARIARDAGDKPIVLRNIVAATTILTRQYYMQMLSVIASVIEAHPRLELRNLKEETVRYLDEICLQVQTEHAEDIRRDVSLRERFVRILDFMIMNGSAYASSLRNEM